MPALVHRQKIQYIFVAIALLALLALYSYVIYYLYIDEVTDQFIEFSTVLREALFYLAILQSIYLIFKIRINYYITAIFYVVAIMLGYFGVVIIIYDLLVQLDFPHVGSDPQVLNLYLFLLAYIPFAIKFFLSKEKTFDRLFIFLLTSIIIVTTGIFHRVCVAGSLKKVDKFTELESRRIIQLEDFQEACQVLGKTCFEVYKGQRVFLSGDEAVNALFVDKYEQHYKGEKSFHEHGRFDHPTKDEAFRYSFLKDELFESERYIINYKELEQFRNIQLRNFNFLSLAAYLFWVCFIHALIYYHNNLTFFRRYIRIF